MPASLKLSVQRRVALTVAQLGDLSRWTLPHQAQLLRGGERRYFGETRALNLRSTWVRRRGLN